MAEGLIMTVLRENNIELSENTFRFHLKVLLKKHECLFESMIARIGRENVLENLCIIYQELEPSNFGRIMAYLTLVFKVSIKRSPIPGHLTNTFPPVAGEMCRD